MTPDMPDLSRAILRDLQVSRATIEPATVQMEVVIDGVRVTAVAAAPHP